MKDRKIIFILCYINLLTGLFASGYSLRWGMKSKFLKNLVEPSKVYETNYCEIICLPSNSFYGNENEEYLLFSDTLGLIAKLYNTNRDFNEVLNQIEKEQKGVGGVTYSISPDISIDSSFLDDKKMFFKPFPESNSFEVLELLFALYDYASPFYADPNDYGAIQTRVINYNGIGYQLELFHSEDPLYIYPAKDLYNSFQKINSQSLKMLLNDFNLFVQQEKIIDFEERNNNIVNHGPFGICWGMYSSEISLIGEIEYKKYGGGFSTDEYEKLYYYDENYYNTHLITPQKKNERIGSYTGIFDEKQQLFQLVCVNYATYVAGIKELKEQEQEASTCYNEMREIISKKYGEGKVISQRGEKCIYWVDTTGQKLELIQNSYFQKNYAGINGKIVYIWMVYSSPEYDENVKRIKEEILEKKKIENKRKQEKEEIQNSYL